MTALRYEVRPRPLKARQLRAVPTGAQRSASIVRPDRPHSARSRALFAVATPASADSTLAVTWSTRPLVVKAARTPAQSRAAVERRQQALLRATGIAMSLIFALALGILLYTALGFGVEAGSVVTVLKGDSLWSIAAGMGADVPTAQIVKDIMELNSLRATTLEAGSQLVLPAY